MRLCGVEIGENIRRVPRWGGNQGDIRWSSLEVVYSGEGALTGFSTDPIIVQHLYVMGMLVELEKVRLGVMIDGIWCGALLY